MLESNRIARYEANLESNHILDDITMKCVDREIWFQQDGARAHREKSAIKFSKALQNVQSVEKHPNRTCKFLIESSSFECPEPFFAKRISLSCS
jgi:hypothetical protein